MAPDHREVQKSEYNPIIAGFSQSQGPLDISLTQAKTSYGQLPSDYGFVSPKESRMDTKSLNLKTGHFIRDLLENKKENLKRDVYRFYKGWHRDLASEFRINIAPFFNINNSMNLKNILSKNRGSIQAFSDLDIKRYVLENKIIRKDILNSIHPEHLLKKTIEILNKRIKSTGKKTIYSTQHALNTLNCYLRIHQLKQYSDDRNSLPEGDALECFTDEISKQLLAFHKFEPLEGIDLISGISGKGIEFEYATRDYSYLELGKETGDCTADKRDFQSDRNIENIFWTVFSWILDKNYQIVKIFFDGEFVMKVHLLPLYVPGTKGYGDISSSTKSNYVFLAIDAMETTLAFRDDQTSVAKSHILEHKNKIFLKTIQFIENLADAMNIEHIYAEKFSNTPWIRDIYGSYPEIFFHVDQLMKIDQLEDVFSIAQKISHAKGYDSPQEVFMELQMKNTYLSPGYINKAPGVKSFALVKGEPNDGVPMKRIIGI